MKAPATAVSIRSPECVDAEVERFLLRDRLEIVSLLRRLQASREPVTLIPDGQEYVPSTLLAVNPDLDELVFDCVRDANANRRLVQAKEVTLVASLDGIKLQLSIHGPDATVFEGRPALRLRFPQEMLRLQRREYYRVPASLTCEMAVECGESVRVLEMRVADLSLGGAALVTANPLVQFRTGQLLRKCHIGLGDLGSLLLTLEVKSVCESATRNGGRHLRIGCEFEAMPGAQQAIVSRYIGQMERERRAKT
jgi:c-di-GMP-binding flagellar brake protein YcgR